MSHFTLPPTEATPEQLLILVRELHASNARLSKQMDKLSKDVQDMRKAFDTASTVVRAIKWLAALGALLIGVIEGSRRLLS